MIPRGVESRTFWVPFWGLWLLAEWPHLFLLPLLYKRFSPFFFPSFFFSSFSFFEKERERESLGFRSPPGLLGLKKKATPTQWLGLKGVGNEAYNDRCFPPLHVSNERRGFLMEAFQHLSFFFLSSCLPTLFTLHSCSIVAGK